MRLPARRIATSALCATFLLGLTGPAAMAAEGESAREHARTAPRAPLPNMETLRAQAGDIGLLGDTLSPVAGLLNAVLKADDGRLTQAEADKHANAVREALAQAEAARTTTPGTNASAGTTQNSAADPVTLPAGSAADPQAPEADLTTHALKDLQKRVDTLVEAVTKAGSEQVRPAADNVVTGVVNILTATLSGGRMPAPDLAGLQATPKAPGEAQQSVARPATEGAAARP
ncbi:hypothetical protein J7I94_06760 [Streptomyces sp. ISL-12]|uniref:hypothetical protein n=1 Tax=Streptomyces sp. ISL-12 TaxID=2819177 RepID=UPI001BEA47E6|nr:hypothetical protein [Streptomyces sp. ISL-12]MBT2410259.1 hypothetical protein [Streptomyces sp. ISL-12]